MRIVIKEEGVDYDKKNAPIMNGPEKVRDVCGDLADSATETLTVLLLDKRNRLMMAEIIAIGTQDAVCGHARETFRTAIGKAASAIVLVHNHPSGDPTPSKEDLIMTARIIEAGKIIDIRLLDHIILGAKGTFFSMRNTGTLQF